MRRDSNEHEQLDSAVSRRDVLKTAGGVATAGALGAFGTGTAAAASYDFAYLTDNVDLNLYQHRYQAEYSATDDRTYHVYQATDTGGSSTSAEDSDGDAYMVALDHSDGSVDGPVRVGYNPISAGDTHGVPCMVIDGDGYIHVIFGAHTSTFQYARSENPYDISSWIHPPSGSSGSSNLSQLPSGTYSCMTYNPNEDAVYVLYRSSNHNIGTLGRSADGGVTWTDVNNGVMDFSGGPGSHNDAYVNSIGAWAGRIHMTWTIAEDHGAGHDDARRNIYHGVYNPSTGNTETIGGKDLGSTITWSDAQNDCMVKDTGDYVISGTYHGTGDSIRGFNHAYDPGSDTVYIGASYALDDNTSQMRVYSYQGASDGSGSWQESPQLVTEDPPRSGCATIVNENGRAEVDGPNSNGEPGLWLEQSDGSWAHTAISLPSGIDSIQRGVVNGRQEYIWYVRGIQKDSEGDAWRNVYLMGEGQPTGVGASESGTLAPQNLREVSTSGTTATIDWDEGRAGTSGVAQYNVYVDGSLHTQVTTQAPAQPYPRTWATIDFGSEGTYDVSVSLVNGNSTESATSNTITVDTGSTSQSPYGGTPWSIPGQIQAEDYDEGGEGVAYHDDDSTNNGGEYRTDGVDIETTGDSLGSAYNVGYTNPDEWLEYTVDVGSSGTYDLDLRTARNNSGSSPMHVEIDGTDVTGQVDIPSTGGWQTWQTVTVTDISLSAGQHVMRVYFDGDGININYVEWAQVSTTSDLQVTVNGSTQTFTDADITSYSGTQDAGTASIEESGDALRLADNAWKSIPLNYSITADTVIEVELETPDEGEVVGVGFDNDDDHTNQLDGSYTVFQLAGSESWSDMIDVKNTFSSPGPQRISIDVGSYYTGSADRMAFVADDDADASGEAVFRHITIYEDTGQSPYGGTPHAIPGRIEAEDYDEGGEGVAYHDDDSTNNGGAYRSDGVDIETTQDSTGTYNVGYVNPDEWLEFTCDVDSSGTYDLDLRIARSPSGSSSMHVEVDGTDVTGTVTVPNTGGWQTWQTVTVTDVSLSAGQHIVRVYFDGDGINFNYMEWY